MSARVYRTGFNQARPDTADVGWNYYRQVSENLLIPQIVERQQQALNVVPDFFRFYQRGYTGRRCSCWMGTETSPAASCSVCFGTGNTAGYQMYGHVAEVFDATAESAAVGCVLDFEQITRPICFRLVHRALVGHVDFTMPVRGGLNRCSLATLHASAPRGTRVKCGVKLFSEPDFTPFSVKAVSDRLQAAQTTGGLHVRVRLERNAVSAPSPRFSHVRIRYQTLEDDLIRGDVPRSAEGNRSSEFGWFDEAEARSLYIGATLRSVTTEDLFRQVNTNKLWKVTQANANAPAGILTSWDLQTRMVLAGERYSAIP